jgi:hypothetical protein
MNEPMYLIVDEYTDKARFVVQRLKKFYENVEVITADKLWKLDVLNGAYVQMLDPDEWEPELLEEVVNRVNETYDEARSIVGMISVKYGVS